MTYGPYTCYISHDVVAKSRGFNFRDEDKSRFQESIIIIIALLKKKENSQILEIRELLESPKIGISQKFNHAKIIRSTVDKKWLAIRRFTSY